MIIVAIVIACVFVVALHFILSLFMPLDKATNYINLAVGSWQFAVGATTKNWFLMGWGIIFSGFWAYQLIRRG